MRSVEYECQRFGGLSKDQAWRTRMSFDRLPTDGAVQGRSEATQKGLQFTIVIRVLEGTMVLYPVVLFKEAIGCHLREPAAVPPV